VERTLAAGARVPAAGTEWEFGRPFSLTRVLTRAVQRAPAGVALVGSSGRMDYRTLDECSNQAAHALRGLGVRPGDRVAVSLPNDLAIVVAIMGIWKSGAVSVGVHSVLAPPEKAFLLDDSGARVLIADPATACEVGAMRAGRPALEHIVVDGPGGTWPERVAAADRSAPRADVDPLALAAIAYTSGTTGVPKGVMHSQHNALLPGAMAAHRGLFGPDEPIAVVHPLTILNLMVLNPLTTLAVRSTCVLCDRHDPASLAAAIREEKVACISVVPTVFHQLLTSPDVVPSDLATLTKPRTGGAAMPEETKRLFVERFGVRPVTSYALTEGPTLVTRQNPEDVPVEGSCGRPLPHIKVEIRDDDDRPVAVGEPGEICFGPVTEGEWAGVYRTMLGYWGRREETARALRGGMVHSGDIGRIDASGEVFLVDRRSQLIIRGGSNIYPAEIERVLGRDPRVAECCVVGRPDQRYGEVVVAFVQPAAGVVLAEEDCRALCLGALARYKVPSEFRFVEALPRGPLGKVARAEVQRLV
jgi:acyl-CoA synthetase (AMP-forming)/AMP-acid ligase II